MIQNENNTQNKTGLNMDSSRLYPVRAVGLVLILLLSSIANIASADYSSQTYMGAPLSENSEDAPLTYSFSPAVRAAFARASDLSQYTQSNWMQQMYG